MTLVVANPFRVFSAVISLWFAGTSLPSPQASPAAPPPGAGLCAGTPALTGSPLPPCSLATQYSSSLISQPTREGKSLSHLAWREWGDAEDPSVGGLGDGLWSEVPCVPSSTARSHRDHPPGAHHHGRSPGRQGGLLPRAGAPLHPLRPLSAYDSPASRVMGQPSPRAHSMLLPRPECPSGLPPKSCCLSVSVSCSPSPRGPPGIAPVTAIKALPEVPCLV